MSSTIPRTKVFPCLCFLHVRGLMGNKRLWRKCRVSSFSSVHIVPTQRAYSALSTSVSSHSLKSTVAVEYLTWSEWVSEWLIDVIFDLSSVPKMTASTLTLWRQRSKEPEPPRSQRGRRRRKEPKRTTLSMTLYLLFISSCALPLQFLSAVRS